MKRLSFVILLVGFLGLLAYKNPTLDDYNHYLRVSISQELQKDSKEGFDQIFSSFLGGIASGVVTSQTVRRDFIFFSLYDARIADEELRVLGVLSNFIVLKKPSFAEESNQ